MRQLGPGVYVDDDGTLHLDARAMCVAAGVEPTKENQDTLEAAAREVFDGDLDVVDH